MGLNINESQHKRPFWPVFVVLLGLIIMVYSVLTGWRDMRDFLNLTSKPETAADVSVRQSVDMQVHYLQSSFFGSSPSPSETSYLTQITDNISARFAYHLQSTKQADFTYTYDVTSRVHSYFAVAGTGTGKDETSDIWTKTIPLKEQQTVQDMARSISIEPSVTIPFTEYRQMTEQLKNAYGLAINGEAIVTFTVHVDGKVDGVAFKDDRTSTISFPLDQQIYRLTTKYDGQDNKKVALEPEKVQMTDDKKAHVIRTIIAFAVGLGLVIFALVAAFRRNLFKSAYQRELDRIYRYHDGIIIKASKEVDLTGKDVVAVQSFDDLLNLEEELKTPIVASRMGDEATRFMIIHDSTVYAYLLGQVLIDETPPSDAIEDENVDFDADLEKALPIRKPGHKYKKK